MNRYDTKPYRDHAASPAITLYLISDDSEEMQKLSCLWCKRTVADIKGGVDTAISTPVPIQDFGIGINIRCKLCHQNYRLVMPQTYIHIDTYIETLQR